MLLSACSGRSAADSAPALDAGPAEDAAISDGSPEPDVGAPDAPVNDAPASDAPVNDAPADGNLDDGSGSDASDAGCSGCLLPATAACSPAEGPCANHTVDDTLYASYRKDFYYPHYQEGDLLNPIPAPTAGGRFNITGVAQQSGPVTNVRIQGQTVEALLAAHELDWYHVYPLTLTAGSPFWVNFHSRNAAWDAASSGQLEVETDQGIAFSGAFPVAVNQAPLKYVGFADDYQTLIVHVEPRVSGTVHLDKVLFNGKDVTASACIADPELAGGVTHLISLPLCQPVAPGDPWTVTLQFDGLPPSTAGGRVVRDFFPIETWQKGDDCPYPMYNTTLFEDHVAHGFDTFFTRPNTPTSSCGSYGQSTTIHDLVGPEAAAHDYHTILTFEADSHFLPYTDVSRIAAAFHADECDDELFDNGEPKPQTRAAYARRTWETWPDLPTYIGGSRLRYNGAFAGATDIQGFDFYVAACAPHITVAGTHPPLRGAFDMLYGVHENHMPHTSWFYTQGLHDGSWNVNLGGTKIYRQPTPAEYRIQALSVLMAGGKGIMYFQTDEALNGMFPATWAEMGSVNRDIRGLRPYLRESDIYRIVQQDGSHVASILRSRKVMALVAINLATSSQPTELQCVLGQNVHWQLADNAPDITFDVPADFQVGEVVELRNGQFYPANFTLQGRDITFPSLSLSETDAGRILLLLEDGSLKDEMLGRMSY